MGHDDRPERPLRKLALRFGTVATAAAALLAEGTASARESDVLKGLLNRDDLVPTVTRETEEPAGLLPPPLILKPSQAEPNWILAGHRSHSSHSSHRSHSSHVSGSGHSSHFSASSHTSHYSSSVGTSSARRSSRGWSDFSPSSSELPSSPPDLPARPLPPPRVDPLPVPKVEPPPKLDRHDPLLRYELITFGTYFGVQKAYIKDHLEGKASLIRVGETIGDCKLVEISPSRDSIRLKPKEGPEFSVKRGHTAK